MQTLTRSILIAMNGLMLSACDFGRVQTISVLPTEEAVLGSPCKDVARIAELETVTSLCADYASQAGFIQHAGYHDGDYIVVSQWWRRRTQGGTISIRIRTTSANQVNIDVFEFPRGTFSMEASNVVYALYEKLRAHNITNIAIGHIRSHSH